jgi:hypothetical protein
MTARKEAAMDMERAMWNPAEVFAAPDDVLHAAGLSPAQKLGMLRRWEYDAREREVAEDENMAGGPPGPLADILAALQALGAQPGEGHPPTKQGG